MAPTDATLARDGYELAELPEGFVKMMAAYVSKWGWPEMGTTVKRPWEQIFNTNIGKFIDEPDGKKRLARSIKNTTIEKILSTLISGTAKGIYVLVSQPDTKSQAMHLDKRVEAAGSLSETECAEEKEGFVLFSIMEEDTRIRVVPGSHKAELIWDPALESGGRRGGEDEGYTTARHRGGHSRGLIFQRAPAPGPRGRRELRELGESERQSPFFLWRGRD